MTTLTATTEPDTSAAADDGTGTPTDWVALAREIGEELRPGVAERDRSGELSLDAVDLLRRRGVTAALVPTEFGGAGATHAELGAFLRELGRHDSATALVLSMHTHVVAAQVWRHHRGADASAVLERVARGSAVLVSTGASDWVGSSGTARPVEGGYRVSARKSPASGCEAGDVLITSVRRDDGPDGPQVMHCSVPMTAEGVRIERTWDALGMRATGSHTVVLDDVFVPDGAIALVRPPDAWPPLLSAVLGVALPLITSPYLGVADAAVELALESAAGRGEPHVVRLVGEMITARTAASDAVAAMFDAAEGLSFEPTEEFVSAVLARKTVACEALLDAVRLAADVVGGIAYARGGEMARLLRDVRGCTHHPLPRAAQTEFTGRVALGRSPVDPAASV